MNTSILQEFLTLQFIPADDETTVEKLKKAGEQLEKKLRKEKARIIPFTLIALDPNTPIDDPNLLEVKELIIKIWPVYVNKAGGDNLITYNRVVILSALDSLSNDINLAGIIWLSGKNIIKHYSLGREEYILTSWLKYIGKKYELAARDIWGFSGKQLESTKSSTVAKEEEIPASTIHRPNLKTRLAAAAGPQYTNDQGQVVSPDNANPNWPNGNQAWVTHFSNATSEAIAIAVNAAIKSNNKEVATYFAKYATNLSQLVNSSLSNKSKSLDLRNQLLWLKESQFSPSQEKSYRDVDQELLPFLIAKDLADIIPTIHPMSVDYFAKEIQRIPDPTLDQEISIKELDQLLKSNSILSTVLQDYAEPLGRVSLYQFVIALHNDKADIKKN